MVEELVVASELVDVAVAELVLLAVEFEAAMFEFVAESEASEVTEELAVEVEFEASVVDVGVKSHEV